MIVADEGRAERVVVSLEAGDAASAALEAAVRVARAFESEIEALFVEDEQLTALAGLPFACEISRLGLGLRPMTPRQMTSDLRALQATLRERMERLASEARVTVRFSAVRASVESALVASVLSAQPAGPRFLAIAEPLALPQASRLDRLLTDIRGAAGLVVVGPRARHGQGPVLAVVARGAEAGPVIRAAGKLAAAGRAGLRIIVGAAAPALLHRVEAAVARLPGEVNVAIEQESLADAGALASLIRGSSCSFLVAGFGSLLTKGETEIRHLTAAADCPLLLVGNADQQEAA